MFLVFTCGCWFVFICVGYCLLFVYAVVYFVVCSDLLDVGVLTLTCFVFA